MMVRLYLQVDIDPMSRITTQDCLVKSCVNPFYGESMISNRLAALGDGLYINDGSHLAYPSKSSNKWTYMLGAVAERLMFTSGSSVYAYEYQYSGPNAGKYEIYRLE
jgi:hypothetical protein